VRVISGLARGRRLSVPDGLETRPTSDRAREGLFSTMESLRGPMHGARVLDLYAGSGAVGLEALSRGATHVTFIESDRQAFEVLRRNVGAVGLSGAVIREASVESVLAGPPDAAYDVVFADPPYADDVADVLAAIVAWLAPEGIVVIERSSRGEDLVWPPGVDAVKERRYGAGTLWYGRRAVDGEAT